MKRCIYAVGCVFILAVTTAAWAQSLTAAKPEDVGLSASRLEKIAQRFKQEINEGHLPGAVIMIARKGKLAYAESFGFQNKDNGTTMSKDAIFRAYSMTKPLVAGGAMTLVEDGRIQLTDPIGKYLPEFDPSGQCPQI
jgi:CubicO group peptidase (beta-lactamase class C family)